MTKSHLDGILLRECSKNQGSSPERATILHIAKVQTKRLKSKEGKQMTILLDFIEC